MPKANPVNEQVLEFQRQFGDSIIELLGEANQTYLEGRGKTCVQPVVEGNTMRWTLAWMQDRVSFDLNIVVSLTNNGQPEHAESVFVHRHASAPYDYDQHTPTTRMRRLNGFSITALREAVEAEFAPKKLRTNKITM